MKIENDVKENAAEKANENNIQIESLSLVELKALSFDEISRIEIAQNNLRLLRAEMAKRKE